MKKTVLCLGLSFLFLLVFGCAQEEVTDSTDPIINSKNYCEINGDCTYYYNYNCVYPINMINDFTERHIREGSPSYAFNCLSEDYFSFICVNNKYEKEEICSKICKLEVSDEECPPTDRTCYLYKNCNCIK